MPVIPCFTIDQIWQKSRARAFLTPRLEEWLKRITAMGAGAARNG